MTLPYKYNEKLESMGIKCCVFNPFIPILSSKLNNRDHRKICVIDGWVGFTGGINLADEYINAYEKHGHWKDCAILLKGEGVWSLTLMFLSIWNYIRPTDTDYDCFRPSLYQKQEIEQDGYVQPLSLIHILKLDADHAFFPEWSQYAVAIGTAVYADENAPETTLSQVMERIKSASEESHSGRYLEPLFQNRGEYEEFSRRHSSATVEERDLSSYEGSAYLLSLIHI